MKNKQVQSVIGRAYRYEKIGGDRDKDGVINVLDCAPNNPNKQGILHNIKARISEHQEASAQRRAASAQIRKKARAEYYREREKQELRVAKEKAKSQADKKIKYHKEGGFAGQLGRAVSSSVQAVDKYTKPQRTSKSYSKRTSKSYSKKRKKRKSGRSRKSYTKPTPKNNNDFLSGGSFF